MCSGGSRISHLGDRTVGGCRTSTLVFFGKNVCENERIGIRAGMTLGDVLTPPPPNQSWNQVEATLVKVIVKVKVIQMCHKPYGFLVEIEKTLSVHPN